MMPKDKSYNIGVSLAKLVSAFPSPTEYGRKQYLNQEVLEHLEYIFLTLHEIHQEYDSKGALKDSFPMSAVHSNCKSLLVTFLFARSIILIR